MITTYKNIIIASIFFFFYQSIKAQQAIPYNLVTTNPFLINPAYTGNNGCLNAFFNNHYQWTNFSNAPMVNSLGIHTKFNKNSNIGAFVASDNRSYVDYLTANLMYAYDVKLNKDQVLTFGISAGVANNKLNTEKLYAKDANDPLVQNFSNTQFDGGFGILYGMKTFKLGASIPHFFDSKGDFSSQYNFQASYDLFTKEKDWKITPMVLARNYKDVGILYDAHVIGTWKETFVAQLGYRTDASLIAGVGLNWKDLLISYAYQYNTGSNYNSLSPSGTQEIQLAIRICRKNDKPLVEKKDPNAEKVNVVINMTDEKYGNPVAGDIIINKGTVVQYSGSGNNSGLSSFYLEPGKYGVEISAKGYLPIQDEMDLSASAKGSKFEYKLKPTKLEKGLVFKFKSINFETGSERLTSSSYQILDKIAKLFEQYPQMIIEAGGYTDNVGDDENNQKLSEKRANAVVNYLKSKGVKDSQLKAVGYGEANPIADNNTDEGRLQNRRVMFTVLEF